jgi:hypothetical protein
MNNNFDTLCHHFEAEQFAFTPHPEAHVIEAGFDLSRTSVRFFAHAPPDEALLTFLLILPVAIPAERRAAMGEFLHRLNQSIRAGAFELNYDEGEVRFALATLLAPDQTVPVEALQVWLTLAMTQVDGFSPALMKVAFGNASPAHALEQAEAAMRDYVALHVANRRANLNHPSAPPAP